MSYYSQIPEANSLHFVLSDYTLDPEFHFLWPNQELFEARQEQDRNRITVVSRYKQKVQQGQKMYLELHRQDDNDVEFDIYQLQGCNWVKVVDAHPADFVIYDSGSVYTAPDGTETELQVHKWHFRFSDFSLDDGTYRVVIPVKFYEGVVLVETRYWISEPIDLKGDHPDTILIQANNNTNKGDVIYRYTGEYVGTPFFVPLWGIRVEGFIGIDTPVRESVDFKEQDKEVRNLNAWGQSKRTITIGREGGVPPYLMNKINLYLAMDNKIVENRRVSVDEDAEWQLNTADNYECYEGVIEVMDYDTQVRTTDTRGSLVDVFTVPSYPFAVGEIYRSPNAHPLLGGASVEITNNTERDDFIDYLNNTNADINNMFGTYALVSGKLKYQNADNENYNFATDLFTRRLVLTVTTSGVNQHFKIGFNQGAGVIFWGDGTSLVYEGNPDSNNTVFDTFSHMYAVADTYEIHVYQFDSVRGINIPAKNPSIVVIGNLDEISGEVSSGLKVFYCQGHDMSGLASGIDLSFILPAKTNITRVKVANCSLSGFDGNIFASSSNPMPTSNQTWMKIIEWNFRGNAMSSAEISSALVDLYNHTPHIIPSLIDLVQVPSVSFSGLSAPGFKNALNNSGHTVLP